MNQDTAIGLLDRLHKAQNEFYAGGSGAALQQILAPNIMWTVPGDNRIAGTYRGLEDVLSYFRRRRDLADHTFQMKRRDALVGDGDRIATMGNAEVQLPPDASKRVPVPLKPHGRRLERRSDDGQNDLETAVDDTRPRPARVRCSPGRSRSKLMRDWQSGEFPPAIKPRVNAYTDGKNSEDANVKRFAPTMYFPADGTFALLSGAERPTLGAVSVISASAAR